MLRSFLRQSALFWRAAPYLGELIPLSFFGRVPDHIVIDVTNVCNLRCPVCPVPFGLSRKRGLMPLSIFQSLIDDLESGGYRPRITFNWSGEPTLNRDLPAMVEYATSRGFYTVLSTNVTKLDAALATKLVDAKLDVATLCMDGFDEKSHESYRIGSKFEDVKSNIEQFVRINRERGGSTLCQVQTLLTAYSEPQTEQIVEWAKQIGADMVSFKTFSLSLDGKSSEAERTRFSHWLPRSISARRERGGPRKSVCTTPLSQSVIYWDGTLGLCCVDMDGDVKMPTILNGGYLAQLSRRDVQRSRKDGFLRKHKICDGCTLGNASEVTKKILLRAT